MLHSRINRPSRKNIDQRSHKRRLLRILMIKTKNTKRNPCQIDPQKNQNLIQNLRLIRRHKHRQQSQRIPDHIIMQSCKNIRTIPDIHIPHRQFQLMLYKNRMQNLPQIPPIIRQRIQMLRNPIMTPHQRLPITRKLIIDKKRNNPKYKRI